MSKKKKVDRLSHLPDCLLHHILSSLNTKQVVQTCILSKRWKHVWTNIPTLNFDFESYPFKVSSSRDVVLKERSFNNFIFSVMSERSERIKKLSYTSSWNVDDSDSVLGNKLISYARRHMVQELWISTCWTNSYDWKWLLSKWESLTVLKISAFEFMDDWRDLMIPSLRILEIHSDGSGDQEDEFTIAGCPNLESLVIWYYYCDTYIITAPKLENLEIRRLYFQKECIFQKIDLDTPNLKCVTFEDVLPNLICHSDISYLEKVNLTIEDYSLTPKWSKSKKVVDKLFELLRVFHNTRSLTMPLKAIEVLLSVPSLSERLSFHNLRHLKLKRERTKKDMLDLPIVPLAYFLKCATLETLVVDLNQD